VLGHPFCVSGKDSAEDDKPFNDIHELLRRYEVDVAMAGDTHDFEFYREKYHSNRGEREMLHFVNGGGGAYLSVGTAGVNGQLRWRDIQVGGNVKPAATSDDDPVEFIAPIRHTP
jgi:hypothetical protein